MCAWSVGAAALSREDGSGRSRPRAFISRRSAGEGDAPEGEIRARAAKRPLAVEQYRQGEAKGLHGRRDAGGVIHSSREVTRSGKSLAASSGIPSEFKKYGFWRTTGTRPLSYS